MAIDSLDEVIAGLSLSRRTNLYKQSQTNVAGGFVSLWKAPGNPTAGANPAAFGAGGAIPTKATAGAVAIGANPAAGRSLYIGRLEMSAAQQGTFILYDRLWACSGMSGAVNTGQVVAPAPVLTRITDYTQVEAWLEVYTAIGATPVTATLSYTNEGNTAGRSATLTTIASAPAGRMMRFDLQAGDQGVRTVASVTLSATTGTAGDFGVTLLRRLAEVPVMVPNVNTVLDALSTGLPLIDQDAALAFMHLGTTTSSGLTLGGLDVIEG